MNGQDRDGQDGVPNGQGWGCPSRETEGQSTKGEGMNEVDGITQSRGTVWPSNGQGGIPSTLYQLLLRYIDENFLSL